MTKKNPNKSHYDVSEIEFSSPQFEGEMLGTPQTFGDFGNAEKIALINETMDKLLTLFEGRYLPKSEAYKAIAKTDCVDVFNYPVLVRCFIDTPLNEHNEHYKLETRVEMAYDDLFRLIRVGQLPKWVDSKLLEYYHTGLLTGYNDEWEEALSHCSIVSDDDPQYEDLDDFIENFNWSQFIENDKLVVKEK